jgi:hypothetical protein
MGSQYFSTVVVKYPAVDCLYRDRADSFTERAVHMSVAHCTGQPSSDISSKKRGHRTYLFSFCETVSWFSLGQCLIIFDTMLVLFRVMLLRSKACVVRLMTTVDRQPGGTGVLHSQAQESSNSFVVSPSLPSVNIAHPGTMPAPMQPNDSYSFFWRSTLPHQHKNAHHKTLLFVCSASEEARCRHARPTL